MKSLRNFLIKSLLIAYVLLPQPMAIAEIPTEFQPLPEAKTKSPDNPFCFTREESEKFYQCMIIKRDLERLAEEEATPELTFFQTESGQGVLILLGVSLGWTVKDLSLRK